MPATSVVGKTILVVEDEDALRHAAERMLRGGGYKVLSAGSGADALALVEEHGTPFDLLLTDVVMPRMSGRELHESLLRQRPGLRVLYMSGYTDNAIAHHGVLDSGVRFIAKPFSADDLLTKVHEALVDGED